MTIRRKYAKTALFSTILTNVGFIINMVYGRILADAIPPSDMGIIAALNTLASLILVLSYFGILYTINQKTAFSIGKNEVANARAILKKGVLVFYAVSFAICIVTSYFLLFLSGLLVWMGFFTIFLIFMLVIRSQSTIMNGMVDTDRAVVFTNLQRWSQWGLSLFLLFFLGSFVGVIFGWIGAVILFAIIGAILAVNYFKGREIGSALPLKTYLTFGLPLYISSVISHLGSQIDRLYVLVFMTSEELARYFLIARITSALNEFSLSWITGVVALLAVLQGINLLRMQKAHSAIVRFVLLITTPLFIAIAVFGEPIAILLIGTNYLGSGIFMSILAVAYFFNMILTIILLGRRAQGTIRILPVVWTYLLILKLGLSFLLAGFGLLGISFATLISSIVVTLGTYLYLRKEIRLGWYWLKLSLFFLVIFGAGFVSVFLSFDIILSLVTCIIAVILSLFLSLRLRILTVEDVNIARSVLSRRLVRVFNLILRIGGYPVEDTPPNAGAQ
jgi:O-antigen/teichoic acid export membrane protein